MLGPGRYSQWRSRFLRYIDTKGNGEYLRKCIFEGPYKLTSVVIEAVAATVNSPENFFKLMNKMKIPTKVNNDKSVRADWDKGQYVAEARETLGQLVVQQDLGYSVYCKGIWALCKGMQEAKAEQADWLEDMMKWIDDRNGSILRFMAKDSRRFYYLKES
ncbi:hypothetical protein Tco_0615325 [Tanacetum coccineum]